MPPALSFVIPLYNSAATIASLVHDIETLQVEGGHEVILVNDGSADSTTEVCRDLVRTARIPITLVEHARNFGEHNAVLTGWRHAQGSYIVNLDDDGQNPPSDAVRLWQHASREGLDVVFGHYEVKRHSLWRNAGSWLTNRMTDWALDKPPGFYLSSFRCVSAFVTRQVIGYAGPYPYIDGLLLQVTQRIGSTTVRVHAAPADPSVAERVAQLFAAAAACGHGRRRRHGICRPPGVRLRGLAVDHRPRSRLRLGLGDGNRPGVLRHTARDARPHRRISRTDVPDREPAAAVGRARSGQ
jgi:undecaprenyl-phosphate 4-deoxy-4-formamido-L-arabinose transferase